MPFCSTLTGNSFEGIADSHRRNSGATFSGSSSSTNASSFGIQETAKWQFCKMTQRPCSLPSRIAASAFGPWPWPNDTTTLRSTISSFPARRSNSAMGSAPDDKTKISGMQEVLKENTVSKLKEGGSKKSFPSFFRMISCKPLMVWSVRTASIVKLFCRGVIWSWMFRGHFSFMGLSESKTRFQSSRSSMKRSLKPSQQPFFKSASSEILAQLASVSHGAVGRGRMFAPVVPPTRSKPFSSMSNSPSTSMDLKVNRSEYISL
mmetsp:Transcript_9149/g.26293  ORF Transcript_9149/g.26293 Transcript_9149/m.26293 type:complete len:262 (+) Transcript_9149:362-1147(+)